MSTAPANRSLDDFHERLLASDAPPQRPSPRANHVRRRGSLEQGRALEALGHAVEYLVDCGLFQRNPVESLNNQAAIQILKSLSRSVFLECPEVLPLRRRLSAWGTRVIGRARRLKPRRAVPPC